MEKEKQIEEMAKVLCSFIKDGIRKDCEKCYFKHDGYRHTCKFRKRAIKLYKAGYGNVKEAVKEAEHRAEVAERAFRNFLAEYFTAVNERNSYACGIPEMFGRYTNVLPYEDKVTCELNKYLNEAEKELSEETK